MNLGLGNLATVKPHLIASTMSADTRFDTLIADIAKGVAAYFEKYCSRKFQRAAGATYVQSANRDHLYLNRYPVESIASVEKQSSVAEGFIVLPDAVQNWEGQSGLVYLGAVQGVWWEHLRITFTGGFFFETLEPTDIGYPTAVPSGATVLPDDLRVAWLLQCRAIWTTLDKLGVDVLTTGSSSQFVTGTLSNLQLVPEVEEIIKTYRRFQIT